MTEVDPAEVTPLVDGGLLRGHLGYFIDPARLASASLLVAGWLREDTGGPVAVPLDPAGPLWSDGFQLMVLTVSNPELLASKTVGPTSRAWPIQQQIDTIRERVKSRRVQAGLAPRGSFPPAPCYPDPVRGPQVWPAAPEPEGGWRW